MNTTVTAEQTEFAAGAARLGLAAHEVEELLGLRATGNCGRHVVVAAAPQRPQSGNHHRLRRRKLRLLGRSVDNSASA